MKIGSISEDLNLEKRLSLTPEISKKYLDLDVEIFINKSYGTHLGFYDNDYKKKGVKILDRRNDEIFTEETIVFSTLIKRPFIQKSCHKIISDKELVTQILEGPAKNSTVKITCSKNEQGSQIEFDAELKLSLKAKFLSPLIKKLYKRYLTEIIFKITERDLKLQESN